MPAWSRPSQPRSGIREGVLTRVPGFSAGRGDFRETFSSCGDRAGPFMSAVSSLTAPDGSRFPPARAPQSNRLAAGLSAGLPAGSPASAPSALAVPTARLRITDAAGLATEVTVFGPLGL